MRAILGFCLRERWLVLLATAGVVAYGAWAVDKVPLDAIPDMIPVVGFSDDLGALAAALAIVIAHVKPKHKEKSQEKDGVRNLLLNVPEINALIQATSTKAAELLQKGVSPVVIIVDPQLRRAVAEIFERFSLDVVTLSPSRVELSPQDGLAESTISCISNARELSSS